jgi:hypothetical protein
MTSTERAALLAIANLYPVEMREKAVSATLKLLASTEGDEARFALLRDSDNTAYVLVFTALKENPPDPKTIGEEQIQIVAQFERVATWFINRYGTSSEVRQVADSWSQNLTITNGTQLQLLANLVDDFHSRWTDYLRPERIRSSAIDSLLRVVRCGPDEFPEVADFAAQSAVDSATELEAEKWMRGFLSKAEEVLGDGVVLRWCQSAIQRFADWPRVWRPALRWLAERARKCGGPRFDLGILDPHQATALGEYWYEFARDDSLNALESTSVWPLVAVPAGSSLATRNTWTWLANEELEAALYAAVARAESNACELWEYPEDRVTSRLLDQLEVHFRQAQAEINEERHQHRQRNRVVLGFTTRDTRYRQDVAGADLALILEASAPGLHKRCSFVLAQSKKPSGNALALDPQLRKQIAEMLYHTHAAYVLIYPNQAGRPMHVIPGTAVRAAIRADARSVPLEYVRGCSRGLAESFALGLLGGWLGDDKYSSTKEVVEMLEHGVRARRIVTISVSVVSDDNGPSARASERQ